MLAAFNGHTDTVRLALLRKRGADVYARNKVPRPAYVNLLLQAAGARGRGEKLKTRVHVLQLV